MTDLETKLNNLISIVAKIAHLDEEELIKEINQNTRKPSITFKKRNN